MAQKSSSVMPATAAKGVDEPERHGDADDVHQPVPSESQGTQLQDDRVDVDYDGKRQIEYLPRAGVDVRRDEEL